MVFDRLYSDRRIAIGDYHRVALQMEAGTYVDGIDRSQKLFEGYADDFTKYLRKGGRRFQANRAAVETKGFGKEKYLIEIVKGHFGSRLPATISTDDITAYRKRLEAAEIGAQTIRHRLGMVRRILRHAVAHEKLHLPNGLPTFHMPDPPKPRDRIASPKEIAQICRLLDEEAALAFRLALETGMRRSELERIQWDDVDFDSRHIHLSDSKAGEPQLVQLTSAAFNILKLLKRKAFAGKSSQKVFGISANTMYRRFAAARDERGIENLQLHDSRHTAITAVARTGLSAFHVQNFARHKDAKSVNRYVKYSELRTGEALRDALKSKGQIGLSTRAKSPAKKRKVTSRTTTGGKRSTKKIR